MADFTIPGKTLSIGVIGLGHRGLPQLKLLAAMADVNIAAVCDFYEDRLQTAVDVLQQEFNTRATPYRTAEDLLAHPGLDAVMIFTAWESHIDLADLDDGFDDSALKRGIVPAMEVGGATSLQECWSAGNWWKPASRPGSTA